MKILRLILALCCAVPAFAQKEALQRGVGTNTVTGSLASTPFQLATIAALKATVVTNVANGTQVYVTGYYATGDGGQGYFAFNSASSATDNGGTIIQPNAGSGRWIREFTGVMNVRYFGARGDGATDDSVSILASVNAAAATGIGTLFPIRGAVYFPTGIYRITTSAVLTPTNGSNQLGVHYYGDGMNASILRLATASTNLYFYNNGTTPRTQFATFSDLNFQGMNPSGFSVYTDIPTYAKGFRLYSAGASGSHEQGFRFSRCKFEYLDEAFLAEGDQTASENSFAQCKFSYIRTTVYSINNGQSLNHQFIATDMEIIFGNVFVIGANGGGALKVQGGSVIMFSSSGVNTYFLKVIGDSGSNAEPFVFSDIRFELRDNYTNLVLVPSTKYNQSTFRSCLFLDTSAADKLLFVSIGAYSTVLFDDCFINQSQKLIFNCTSAANFNENGTISFNRCAIPPDFSDQMILTNGYGNVSASDCRGENIGAAGQTHYAQDFDINGVSATQGPVANWAQNGASLTSMGSYIANVPRLKSAYLKVPTDYWNIGAAAYESVLRLPKGAIIRNILFLKPANAGDASAITWNVGNSNKSVVHFTTGVTANNVALNMSTLNYFYSVGATDNERNLVMYISAGAPALTTQGGFILIEYY